VYRRAIERAVSSRRCRQIVQRDRKCGIRLRDGLQLREIRWSHPLALQTVIHIRVANRQRDCPGGAARIDSWRCRAACRRVEELKAGAICHPSQGWCGERLTIPL